MSLQACKRQKGIYGSYISKTLLHPIVNKNRLHLNSNNRNSYICRSFRIRSGKTTVRLHLNLVWKNIVRKCFDYYKSCNAIGDVLLLLLFETNTFIFSLTITLVFNVFIFIVLIYSDSVGTSS